VVVNSLTHFHRLNHHMRTIKRHANAGMAFRQTTELYVHCLPARLFCLLRQYTTQPRCLEAAAPADRCDLPHANQGPFPTHEATVNQVSKIEAGNPNSRTTYWVLSRIDSWLAAA